MWVMLRAWGPWAKLTVMFGSNVKIRSGLLLAAMLAGGVGVAPAAATAAGSKKKDEGAKARSMALVKVEIKLESGDIVRNKGELVEWDEDATVVFDGAGHSHAVQVHVHKNDDKGKRLAVKMGYSRDSNPVIAPFAYETAAKKREIIHSDGGLALAITIIPKKVKPQEKPRRDDSIEGPDDPNDPLGGI